MLAIRQRDVCALDPTRDSHTCPDSSIYRYQSGCHGAACRLRQHEAYERRKNNKATKAVAKPVKSARKLTAVKPTPTKKARPTKKAAVKKTTPSKRVAKRLAS